MLATSSETVELVKKLDSLAQELSLEKEVVAWRLRLAAMTRNMSHDELYVWLEQLKITRADSEVIRAGVVAGPVLASSLAREEMTDWEVYRVLRTTPVEALLLALAGVSQGVAEARLRRYLAEVRSRTLSVAGDDILALGVKKGPAVGGILERLRELRVQEVIQGREQELEAAREMVEKAR
jgi:hypothetical protein